MTESVLTTLQDHHVIQPFECKITRTGEGIARSKASLHGYWISMWRIVTLTVSTWPNEVLHPDSLALGSRLNRLKRSDRAILAERRSQQKKGWIGSNKFVIFLIRRALPGMWSWHLYTSNSSPLHCLTLFLWDFRSLWVWVRVHPNPNPGLELGFNLNSTVPCLHGAVELLLTGDQHKPCASFNQQAYKNTTSVAEGKRKTPQKNASKGAKICKTCPHFGVQKWTRFGVCLNVRILFLKQTSPQNGTIFGPQNGQFFYIFLRLLMHFFAGFFRLPSATDVVFLYACWLKPAHGLCWSPVNSNSTAPCRHGTGEANESGLVWRLAFWPPFWGPKLPILWRHFGTRLETTSSEAPKSEPGKAAACRQVNRWRQLNHGAKASNKTTWRQHVMTEHV